jgi:hypothetical protein
MLIVFASSRRSLGSFTGTKTRPAMKQSDRVMDLQIGVTNRDGYSAWFMA